MTKHNMRNFGPFSSYKTTHKQRLNGEKLDVGYLLAFGWYVLLCCFGVQCLEECWHDNTCLFNFKWAERSGWKAEKADRTVLDLRVKGKTGRYNHFVDTIERELWRKVLTTGTSYHFMKSILTNQSSGAVWMKVEVAVLGFLSLIVCAVSVGVKQHWTRIYLPLAGVLSLQVWVALCCVLVFPKSYP